MPRMNKEEEKVEKIIRGLLKLPDNKRCINCNSLGPQYVCTTFWTFICTNCSGIHREFTHRVKSVSMATFSMEDVNALQGGGNERGREIYFKTLDLHRNPIPDSSNLHRLREFIKHVYVDRKYTGDHDQLRDDADDCKDKHSGAERSNQGARLGHSFSERSIRNSRDEEPSNERPRSARDAFLELFSNGPFSERPREGFSHRGAREDFLGRPSFERPRGNVRSDFLDRHSFDTPNRGVRDDFLERHSFENSSSGPRDEFPSSKSSLRNTMSSRNFIEDGRSPPYKQEDTKSGSQRSRKPRFEIVDDRFRDDNTGNAKHYDSIRYSNTRHSVGNASPGSPRRRDTRKTLAICSAKDASDNKFPPLKAGEEGDLDRDSTIGKENESNKATATSLMDSDPTTSTIDVDEREKKTSSLDNDEASDTQNVTPLESLLLDWTAPSNTTPEDSTEDSTSTMPNGAVSTPSELTSDNQRQVDLSIQTTEANNENDLSSDVEQGAASVIAESNQNWSPAVTNDNGSLADDLSRPSPQPNSQQTLETSGSHESQNSNQALQTSYSNESQQSKRKELPVGLFAGSYPSFPVRGPVPVAVPGWQLHPHHGMGYGMQFQPVPMCVPPFTATGASRNPFDIGGDGPQTAAAQTFPHIPLVHGVQPNMIAPTGFQHQESSHTFSWQSHQYPYGMPSVPGAFQGHEIVPYDTMDTRNQCGQISSDADVFASLNPTQRMSTRHSAPSLSNSSSTSGGNPFG